MNTHQRTLTVFAISAFALTALFAPWDLTSSPNHTSVIRYAPLFAPPPLDVWAKRELASGTFWAWMALAIVYGGLFAVLEEPTTALARREDGRLSQA